MLRQTTTVLSLSAALLSLATPTDAQACYENDHQCFSFAPAYEDIDVYDTGVPLEGERYKIRGDIRLRARMANAPNDAPYNEADQQATRARVSVEFKVNEHAHVFAEYNFSETWAGSVKYSDADPANPVNELAQAYLHVDDLFGWDDTWRVGRSNYNLGNGLVLGSCDFLQYPSTFTGVWASKQCDQLAFEAFAFDNYGQLNLMPGTRFAGLTTKYDVNEDLVLKAYYMTGTGDGDLPSDDAWLGVDAGGNAPAELDWVAEYAHRKVDGGDDLEAYRGRIGRNFDGLLERVSFTRTGSQGAMHVNPADFNSAGLVHQYGGAWRSDINTNQLGFDLAPCEELDLNFNLLTFSGSDAMLGDTELDVLVGKHLAQGIYGSIGYGRDNEDRQVGYVQLTAYF